MLEKYKNSIQLFMILSVIPMDAYSVSCGDCAHIGKFSKFLWLYEEMLLAFY